MSKSTKEKAKKRVVKVEAEGQVHIQASFNNIIVSVTNMNGDVISWASAGKMNFRGSKKNTPYAAQVATTECVKQAYELGLRKADVYVKGPGSGREAAIRAVQSAGVEINMIYDVTPIPHNGCRPPKKRRV